MSLQYNGPRNPNPQDGESSIIIYGYVPSKGLALTGVITFALILLINLWYIIKKKGKGYKSFHWLLLVGSVSLSQEGEVDASVDGDGWICSEDRFEQSTFFGLGVCRSILLDRRGGLTFHRFRGAECRLGDS